MPVFIWSPDEEGEWAPGGASRWWLRHSLAALDESLRRRASRLTVRTGASLAALRALARETGARTVVWNRRYEPASIARDTGVKQALLDDGIEVRSFNGPLIHSPPAVRNKSDKPFQVFTPFWKHCATLPVREELPAPRPTFPAPGTWPGGEPVDALGLLPSIRWDREFPDHWTPGEAGARRRLETFLADGIDAYAGKRDRPDLPSTSGLSPHLHFGEISPVRIHHAVRATAGGRGAQVFMSEVGWREFAHHLLFHFPHTPTEPLRQEFGRFPWRRDRELLRAWQRGRTGYPVVDAGMRQLWRTGWMHNRVRMVVASFLVKHLLQPWQDGARWFWDTLVDADLAANTLGWQWSAGCGADAAPYFRVFNPILQGLKFDPDGSYVRRWVPELAGLPAGAIHAPWDAPPGILAEAGVRLGETYPHPVVQHQAARDRALEAYARLRDEG